MVGFLTLVLLAVLHQSRGAFEVVHGMDIEYYAAHKMEAKRENKC